METVGEALVELARGTPLADRLNDRVLTVATGHHERLLRWNQVHNLTRVEGVEAAARSHWADSLLAALRIEEEAGPLPDRVVDVGSGAGFPGVCVAALWPGTTVTLLEPSRKRCSFLQRVRAELSLTNVVVREGRVEDADETWPAVMSRATFRQDAVGSLSRVCGSGGWLAALVGEVTSPAEWQERARAESLVLAQSLPYGVPGLERRAVLFARKP